MKHIFDVDIAKEYGVNVVFKEKFMRIRGVNNGEQEDV